MTLHVFLGIRVGISDGLEDIGDGVDDVIWEFRKDVVLLRHKVGDMGTADSVRLNQTEGQKWASVTVWYSYCS